MPPRHAAVCLPACAAAPRRRLLALAAAFVSAGRLSRVAACSLARAAAARRRLLALAAAFVSAAPEPRAGLLARP